MKIYKGTMYLVLINISSVSANLIGYVEGLSKAQQIGLIIGTAVVGTILTLLIFNKAEMESEDAREISKLQRRLELAKIANANIPPQMIDLKIEKMQQIEKANYGILKTAFMEQKGITEKEAKKKLNKYFNYPHESDRT